jgi:hypothetical protein
MVLEAIEVCRPELAVRREPVVELFERIRPDAIQAALRVRAHLHEPRIFEDAEMLGDGRLADAEPVDELADRLFAVAEQVEDRQTARLGKDLECSETGDANEYSYSVICLSSNQRLNLAVPRRAGEDVPRVGRRQQAPQGGACFDHAAAGLVASLATVALRFRRACGRDALSRRAGPEGLRRAAAAAPS